MGESSNPVQLGLALNTDNSWSKNKQERWVFLCLQNVPKNETEIKTVPSDIDDLQENDVVNQNPVSFGKNNNLKYPEILTEFLSSNIKWWNNMK